MIFLSHSSKDGARAEALAEALKGRGLKVWFAPRDVPLGSSFPREIGRGLDESDRLLVAWSAHAASSDFVLDELHSFYKANPRPGHILFMLLDETKIPTLFGDRLYFRPTGDAEHDAAVIEDWAAGQGNSEPLRSNKALEYAPRNPRDSKARALVEHIASLDESVRHDPLTRRLLDRLDAYELEPGREGREPARHPLHDFPRGPMVELHRVSGALVRAYAALLDSRAAAHTLIQEANRLRLAADPGDPEVTTIGLEYLPSFEVGAYSFWMSALYEACRHGPRMLAALLLAQPHTQFPHEARADRAELLDHLRSLKSAQR